MRNIFGKNVQPGSLGIEISPFGIAIARVDRAPSEGLGSCECHYIEGANFAENGRALKNYLSESGFEKMPTHVVLHPAMYDIYFVDRPEVDDSELDEAVKWKIKDLVDEPLKNLVVDAFGLPLDAYRGAQKKVYAVTTQREALEDIVNTVKNAGAQLKSVNISELAVRNIVNLLHEDEGGAALLRMRNSSGTINLTDSGNLYLTRNIESGISMLESSNPSRRESVMDEMLLEIQRSLDYYDSQLGKGLIRNFLMAPTRLTDHKIDDYLSKNLGIKVHSLDVNEMFEVQETLSSELQGNCFAAIGAACSDVVH